MIKISARQSRKGPLFDGTALLDIDKSLHQMEGDLATEGVRRIHQRLGQVLRHPTGYYSSRVVATMRSDGYDVTDSNVIYGPWLEGTSRRNVRSRFKGYRTFQLVSGQLDRDAEQVLRPDIEQMIKAVNGGN